MYVWYVCGMYVYVVCMSLCMCVCGVSVCVVCGVYVSVYVWDLRVCSVYVSAYVCVCAVRGLCMWEAVWPLMVPGSVSQEQAV